MRDPKIAAVLAVVATTLMSSCTDPLPSIAFSLSDPGAFAFACLQRQGNKIVPADPAKCDGSDSSFRLTAFVANGPAGDISIMDLTSGDPLDTDPMIPGHTGLYIGGYPQDIVAAPDSSALYVLDPVETGIVTIDPITLEFSRFPIAHSGARIAFLAEGPALLVTLPGKGALLRVALGDDGLPMEAELHAIGGTPLSLEPILDADELPFLAVGHQEQHYLSLVDGTTMTEIWRIGLLQPCRDGLDNDGDGLLDGDDPGCDGPDDFDESDDPEAVPLACANGEDDDGDGLTDLADPGCLNRLDNTEVTDNNHCSDGIDNDSDGATDADDQDCITSGAAFESPPQFGEGVVAECDNGIDDDNDGAIDLEDSACTTSNGFEQSLYPCFDGIDNDGDGLADYPEDPDCFSAGWTSEKAPPPPMAEVSVSPDGRWAYVVHRGLSMVAVLNLSTGELVDVNSVDDSTHRRLKKRQGVYGIGFPSEATTVTLRRDGEQVLAYVTDVGGQCTMVEVSKGQEPLHHVAEAILDTPKMASAAKPHLYSDSQEIQLGHSPVMGFPNLGPLIVEEIDPVTGQDSYYGIVFNDDARSQRSESWRVEFEGALPGTGSLRALPVSSTALSVPGADLCSLGALPGDLLVFNVDEGNGCEKFADGGTFNYTIAEVDRDWITLEPDSGWRLDEDEQRQVLEDLNPACFPLPLRFTIRPPAMFVVRGSKTGYLHNVEATAEGCREAEDGDPLFSGRAIAASLLPDKTLPNCPATEAGAELELHTFTNPVFSVDIFPACTLNDEGAVEMVETSRGTLWTFSASSAFVSQVILSAALPVDALLHEPEDRLYLLDLAGKSLKAISLDSFSLIKSYY